MTVRQAATALEVSPALVYKLVKAGNLVGFKIGRIIRIEPSSLDEFKRGCQIKAPGKPVPAPPPAHRLVIPDGFAMLKKELSRKRS